ncbi:MAG: Membrane protein, partial [Pedobacter sp.]|nr:Membrane protein [Pedobacter sp.]
KTVQKTITPALVSAAIKRMPRVIYQQNGTELNRELNGRVNNLDKFAMDYYKFLAKTVEVPASDERELFLVSHQPKGDIDLQIFNLKKDSTTGRRVFHRLFKAEQTKEIRLYGFAEDDVFKVTGRESSGIKVRMVGGEGKDSFQVEPDLRNRAKNYIYDRKDQEVVLPSGRLAKIRLANDTLVNSYNQNSFRFDRLGPLFRLSYSADQGLQPGIGLIYEKQGFRKIPYASKNEFWVNYSIGRKSFHFTYAGDFKEAVGKNDLKIDIDVLGPNNQSNFFGVGNNTQFANAGSRLINYYRNYYDYINADFKLKRSIAANLTIEGGLSTEYFTSTFADNTGRFLREFNETNPGEEVFNKRFFAGLVGVLTYDNRDNASMPKKGLYWRTEIAAKQQISKQHDRYGRIESELRFYLNPGSSGFVVANRIGVGTTLGDPEFYQRIQLGGINNLRGFHSNRFTGKTGAFYNLDLRLKLFNFTSYITPGAVGLIAFNDVGRVWEPGESSTNWHDGYGGGFYVIPAELVLIQATVGHSKEGTLPYISVGFSF